METYFEVDLSKVPSHLEEEISALCFSFGATGVVENMKFTQMRDDYAPEEVKGETKRLTVYFEKQPSAEFLAFFETKFTDISLELRQEQNKDWMQEWKKDFKAFALAGDYWVVPSWLEAPKEAVKCLSIDPGMAFGTGTHETTQLASEILVKSHKEELSKSDSVLDVGTGTGILAMLCRLEFAKRVVTTEIDVDARVVARANFAKNETADIELPDTQIESLDESFDLVIANIIDGVLTKLKMELIAKTKPGGYLIITGILQERDSDFINNFLDASDLEVVDRVQKSEWIGYLLKRAL